SRNSVAGLSTIEKKTGTLRIGLPAASKTLAVMCVDREFVIRGGSAVRKTLFALTLPIVTSTEALVCPATSPVASAAAALMPTVCPTRVVVVVEGRVVLLVLGVVISPPPDVAVMWAVPDRLSDTKFTRQTPSFVFPCSGMLPRFVKNWMTVP